MFDDDSDNNAGSKDEELFKPVSTLNVKPAKDKKPAVKKPAAEKKPKAPPKKKAEKKGMEFCLVFFSSHYYFPPLIWNKMKFTLFLIR